jgi:hypothetical protein
MVKDLTEDQKHILLKEGTELAGTSPLNHEQRKGDYYCVGCDTKLFESKKNTIVEVDGHLFLRHYQMYLKLKSIIQLVYSEQNITAKNVEGIMVTFLMMDLNQLEKDIVITEPV